MLFKIIMKKKALQGPAELDVQAAVFRVGRHATLLFNNVIRIKEAVQEEERCVTTPKTAAKETIS